MGVDGHGWSRSRGLYMIGVIGGSALPTEPGAQQTQRVILMETGPNLLSFRKDH